jgi:hypothetical protein
MLFGTCSCLPTAISMSRRGWFGLVQCREPVNQLSDWQARGAGWFPIDPRAFHRSGSHRRGFFLQDQNPRFGPDPWQLGVVFGLFLNSPNKIFE